jgi:gas vesicle protein
MSKTSNLLLGVLGAAAAGVVIGLLIAPDKGSETRKKISKKTADIKDQVTKAVQSGKDYLSDVAASVTKESEGMKHDAVAHFDRVKSEIN